MVYNHFFPNIFCIYVTYTWTTYKWNGASVTEWLRRLTLKLLAPLRWGSNPMRGGCQLLTEGCWFTPMNNLFLQLWKPHLTSPWRTNMYIVVDGGPFYIVVLRFGFSYMSICIYMFVTLIFEYFHGKEAMLTTLQDDMCRLNYPPCCCCLICLPRIKLTR